MTCTAKPPPPQIIVCINPQMCLYTPQKREGQQSQGENQQKPAILAHFPHQTAGKVSHLGENWAEKWDYFRNFGWGEVEGVIGRGNVGTHGQHVGQTHPSTPSHAPGTALPSAGIASKEKQGAARGCSFGKAGRCFGSGMAARIGNLDWELVGFSHQILQFWHGVLFPNPFLQHYPMGWIWFSSCLGFLVLPKTGFVGHFLNVKSHISCGYSYF